MVYAMIFLLVWIAIGVLLLLAVPPALANARLQRQLKGVLFANNALGTSGFVGEQGEQGATGMPGVTGPQFPSNSTGPVGPPGPSLPVTGAQGPDGLTGNTGPSNNLPSPTGPDSATGPTGASLVGATGLLGIPGVQGPRGPNGATGGTGATGFYNQRRQGLLLCPASQITPSAGAGTTSLLFTNNGSSQFATIPPSLVSPITNQVQFLSPGQYLVSYDSSFSLVAGTSNPTDVVTVSMADAVANPSLMQDQIMNWNAVTGSPNFSVAMITIPPGSPPYPVESFFVANNSVNGVTMATRTSNLLITAISMLGNPV